uniref:ATP-grasp domain-containing protein n=1 Tax=candidate division CPR3 bacterium TaxID=2268181 RepID=A0A7C4M026_UNCC3
MNALFFSEDIFFVTPDIKRAIGIENIFPHYHIICSYNDPLISILRKKGVKIFCLSEQLKAQTVSVNNSGNLLANPLVERYINLHSRKTPFIVYFKPSLKIDYLIKKKKYKAIGNSFDLNEQFENKIRFFKFSNKYFPEFSTRGLIGILSKLKFNDVSKKLGLPMVMQLGHGWAGKTTYFINTEKEFLDISNKFPLTMVKLTSMINGYTILNNCCIYKDKIFISPPAVQIDGIPELYPRLGVTCGRQWPAKFLERRQISEIIDISKKTGKILMKLGYRGFFGLDFLIEEKTGKVYFSEINARLTASSSFYAYLERGLGRVPLFIYHIASFLDKDMSFQKWEGDNNIVGSQVIFRKNMPKLFPFSNKIKIRTYTIEDEKYKFIKENYAPDKLGINEFIYMIRKKRYKEAAGEEVARIEARKEVLSAPHKLNSWFKKLL